MKIFIVDDDDDDREFFCEGIAEVSKDINCIKLSNCEKALSILAYETVMPDYIFLDINMPRMNGMQCLGELKKDVILKDIPVIMFSTSKTADITDNAKALGAEDYIVKPYSMEALVTALTKVLKINKG